MDRPTLFDQLADIRATLTRLKHQESRLERLLRSAKPAPPGLRPGWPITRRGGPNDTNVNRHPAHW